jgi:hypothetical protein
MTDRINDPTAHDLPTTAEQGLPSPRERQQQLLGAVRIVATLGHGCGLVDPYPRATRAPMAAILERLAEVSPWLTTTWEFRRAVERTGAQVHSTPEAEAAEAGRLQGEYGEEAPSV